MAVLHQSPQSLGIWPPIIQHLVQSPTELADFHNGLATEHALKERADQRVFDPVMREVLCAALNAQYIGFDVPPATRTSLKLLAQPETTTVTTGHQLCLAGGPLFMLSKIASAVSIARSLTASTGKPVVPVFWMASEDHDLDEIDHFHLGGETLRWSAQQTGAVGRMHLRGLKQQFETWSAQPELEGWKDALLELASVYDAENLAAATRAFVHKYFSEYGVVVLDGDDASLKKAWAPIMWRELADQPSESLVQQTTQALIERGYKAQVHPRNINLFYLTEGGRHRILHENGQWTARDTPYSWDKEGLRNELDAHPERFSPNVVLRPVYQESILPNLAYIGGPGEMSYWLQLKGVFEELGVTYPLLRVRHSVALIPAWAERKRAKLGMEWSALFQDKHLLEAELARRLDPPNTATARAEMERVFDQLQQAFGAFDATLERSVAGERAKLGKAMDQLDKKVIRSAKQRSESALNQLHSLLELLFPQGTFQERRTHFLEHQMHFEQPIAQRLVEGLEAHSTDVHFLFKTP